MRPVVFAIAALIAAIGPAAAGGGPLEIYTARLSADDHYNSNGARLADPAAIIRQDRANFHEFGIRDREDESDRFFAAKANRARLEALLRAGRIDRFTRRLIVDGTPLVTVEVYDDFIAVTAER
jgi:hypothetical protein